MSELDQLMDVIRSKYETETLPLKIGERTLQILQLKDFEELVEDLVDNKDAGLMDLPLWAKVWEGSFLLAYFLGKQPVIPGQRMLEIGAGLGVVGLYAALCGHTVTITDINDDALLFARANALLNDIPQADVRKLDWNDPDLPNTYDVIIGSEVIYDRRTYPQLVAFLKRALAPGGIVFLTKNSQMNTPAFFKELSRYFELKQTTQTIRTNDEAEQIDLFAIRLKSALENSENPGEGRSEAAVR